MTDWDFLAEKMFEWENMNICDHVKKCHDCKLAWCRAMICTDQKKYHELKKKWLTAKDNTA